MYSLYTSDLTCGDHDIEISGRYKNKREAVEEAERLQTLTLKQSDYMVLVRVVKESMTPPWQDTVYEAIRDVGAYDGYPTTERIKWRVI